MAKISRADIVVARIPKGNSFKMRPVLVVQSDHNNARLVNIIAPMITSNTKLATKESTQVLVDLTTPFGKSSGLAHTSVVKCENLYTIAKSRVHKIGHLPDTLMEQVDAALKVSLDLQ